MARHFTFCQLPESLQGGAPGCIGQDYTCAVHTPKKLILFVTSPCPACAVMRTRNGERGANKQW
jgi:hypothetical protein